MNTATKIMAPLTFNSKNLAKIGNDSGSTGFAILIILINSILAGLETLNTEGPGQIGTILEDVGGVEVAGIMVYIVEFGFYLLFLIILSWGIKVVVGWFGGKADSMEVLRMIGFASIWSIVATIVGFFFESYGLIFLILFIIALSVGLGASAEINPIAAFIACLLGIFVVIITIFLVFLGLAFLIAILV